MVVVGMEKGVGAGMGMKKRKMGKRMRRKKRAEMIFASSLLSIKNSRPIGDMVGMGE